VDDKQSKASRASKNQYGGVGGVGGAACSGGALAAGGVGASSSTEMKRRGAISRRRHRHGAGAANARIRHQAGSETLVASASGALENMRRLVRRRWRKTAAYASLASGVFAAASVLQRGRNRVSRGGAGA